MSKFRDYMNTVRNFAKSVSARIFAKLKYLAKSFMSTESTDQVIFIGSQMNGGRPVLIFYHFNSSSEPTYESQHIKVIDVIAACNQLTVNALT